MLQYGNAPRNLICAFHALSLLSLIYPTWCVGVYGCEICFLSMARIPHCSCQQEGENVRQDLARFSKTQAPTKQIQRRRIKSGVALSIQWLCMHHDIIISCLWTIMSVTMQTWVDVITLRWLRCLKRSLQEPDKSRYIAFSFQQNKIPHFSWLV